MSKSRTLRLIAFCLLVTPIVLWSLSRVGAHFVSPTAIAQVESALAHRQQDASRHPSHGSGTPSHPILVQFWQVGLQAGADDANAIGARSFIQTRLPQQVSDNTTDYFWVGAYLSDGSFIQAGYFVPWYDETHAGWFYCAFYPDGREGPCVYGASGSAGGNGSDHLYTLAATTGANDNVFWKIAVDSIVVGKFAWSSGNTGTYVPMIYAESSGFVPHPGTSQLGPVDFRYGLEILHAGRSRFEPALHLYVMYSAPAVCPPYGIGQDRYGGILLGSGLPCPALHADFD